MQEILSEINKGCEQLKQWVYDQSIAQIKRNKIPAVLGGDHGSPLGLLKALYETHDRFGVLHIDAHMDLCDAYEGFTYSKASILIMPLMLYTSSNWFKLAYVIIAKRKLRLVKIIWRKYFVIKRLKQILSVACHGKNNASALFYDFLN
jgi:arginase family enzyme